MSVLSIQSSVVLGYVGNDAATLPLQRFGFDVWRVPTVLFSNHPAHGRHAGRVLPAAEVGDLIDGVERLGRFPACRAVMSGYLGDAATGALVARTVARVREANPAALYLCDPVIGDHGHPYVGEGVAAVMRDTLLPLADIAVPNCFEATILTGVDIADMADAFRVADRLAAMGPSRVVVTGVADGDNVATIGVDGAARWCVATPVIDHPAHGAGDLFSALLLGHLLAGRDLAAAGARAVSSVFAVIVAAAETDSEDLPLIAAQDALLSPPRLFDARPVR